MSYDPGMTYDRASVGARPPDDLYPGRRQLDTLLPADLSAAGVWWFPPPDGHLSGPDAGTVMPLDTDMAGADGSIDFPEGRFLLRVRFTLADRAEFDGHLTFAVDDDGGLRDREPTLCTEHGQVPLWHGLLIPSDEQIAEYLGWLGRPRDAVFPLQWQAVFHPPADHLAGTAAGFVVWRGDEVDVV